MILVKLVVIRGQTEGDTGFYQNVFEMTTFLRKRIIRPYDKYVIFMQNCVKLKAIYMEYIALSPVSGLGPRTRLIRYGSTMVQKLNSGTKFKLSLLLKAILYEIHKDKFGMQ